MLVARGVGRPADLTAPGASTVPDISFTSVAVLWASCAGCRSRAMAASTGAAFEQPLRTLLLHSRRRRATRPGRQTRRPACVVRRASDMPLNSRAERCTRTLLTRAPTARRTRERARKLRSRHRATLVTRLSDARQCCRACRLPRRHFRYKLTIIHRPYCSLYSAASRSPGPARGGAAVTCTMDPHVAGICYLECNMHDHESE